MAPAKLPLLARQDIPEEIIHVLAEAACVNRNYEITRLSREVRDDISRVVFNSEGEKRTGAALQDRVNAFRISLRARVAQICPEGNPNPVWTRRERGALTKDFEKSPRTALKSIQEYVTHRADLVVPAEDERPRDLALLQHLIIDPAKISPALLAHLGLAPKPRTLKGFAQKVEHNAQAIPAIKELLSHLEPLQVYLPLATKKKHAYRLFRVLQGPKAGMIVGFQEFIGTEGMFLTDLHGADRRFKKIETQYPKEQEELVAMCEVLSEINTSLDSWIAASEKPSNIDDLLGHLDQLNGQVLHVKNPWKVKIRVALEKSRTLLGGTPPNPTAARACINNTRIQTLAMERIQEIQSISGTLGRDKSTLSGNIKREYKGAEDLYMTMNRKRPLFRPIHGPSKAAALTSIRTEVTRIQHSIFELRFQPYKAFGDAIEQFLGQVPPTIEPLHTPAVRTALAHAYTFSKFARVWHALMRVYENFSMKGTKGLDTRVITDFLEKMRASRGITEVFPGLVIPEYESVWNEIEAMYDKLEAFIHDYNATKLQGFSGDPARRRKRCVTGIKNDIRTLALPDKVQMMREPLHAGAAS